MKLIVLLALVSLSACGTKTQPPPQDSFFEPAKFDEYAPPEPNPAIGPDSAVDLSWWDVDKEVVLHPLETSLSDDPIFWDWEGTHRSYQPGTSPDLLREVSRRVSASAWIKMFNIGPVYSELQALAEREEVSVVELSQDRWIALGTPFNDDTIHVFQIPTHPNSDNDSPHIVYETKDFVLLGFSQHLTLVFDPQSIREGIYGNVPAQFQPLFDLSLHHAVRTTTTFLYPSQQQLLTNDFLIANDGLPSNHMIMVRATTPYTEIYQESPQGE